MRAYRSFVLVLLIAIGAWSTTMSEDVAEANHGAAADEFTITHSGGDPGPGGGGTTLNVPVGGVFSIEARATTITTSAPGYGYALSWSDAVVNPLLHIVDSHCTANPTLCTCVGPTAFTLGAAEGVTGSCVRNLGTGLPPGPPPPIAAGETLVTSTLTCASAGTTQVQMLGSDSNPAAYTSLRTALGIPIATALENQLANPAPPPATVAAVSVVCYTPVDAAIAKTAPPAATEGETVVYTLALTNTHPTLPLDLDLSDTAPAGVTFTSFTESDPGACTMTASSLTCEDVRVAAAGAGSVTISARFDSCGAIANSATITGVSSPGTTVLDIVPANDASSANTAVACTVDASIAKSGPASVPTGGSGTYITSATNPDAMPSIDVMIVDTAPPGVTFTAVDNAGCAITGGTLLQCALTLAPASTTIIHLDATFAGCVPVVNAAALTVLSVLDPNPANNAAATTTDVQCIVDASIAKTGPTSLLTGAAGTYVLSATNPDPALPIAVTLLDTAPAGVTFDAVDNLGCMISGGTMLTCTLTIAPASTTVINLDATFTGCVAVANTAVLLVTPPIIDTNPANNAAAATTDVACLVDASVVKTGPQYVHPTGSVDTYVIEATNPDPTFVLNGQLLDIAPPGVTFTAVDHPGCLITGGVTLQCTIAILPSSTETVNVTATFGVCGLAPNTATLVVGTPILDPNPANNVSTVVTSVCGSPDIDMDGCTEFEELGPDHRLGGQRTFIDGNDFFDVPTPADGPVQPDGRRVLSAGAVRNKAISLVDVGVVLEYVGRTPLSPAYTADNNGDLLPDGVQLDRRPSLNTAELWRAGAPNGAISLQDVAVALASVGDNCQAIPN